MASFWSGLTGLFTGKAQEDAARASQGALNQGYQDYLARSGQGIGALQDQYYQGIGALNQNYAAALQPFTNMGPSAFQPYNAGAMSGTNAYLDASGANGPAGLARAQQNYVMSPGTQNAIDQAVKSAGRTGVAGGQATGNIQAAAADRATKLAQQDYYGNYLGALAPFLGYGLNVAGGLDQYGRGQAGDISRIYQGLGTNLAGMYGNLGQGIAGIYGNQATAGMNTANQLAGLKGQEVGASAAGAANAINLGLNIARLFNPFGDRRMGSGGMGLPQGSATGGLY